MKTLYTLQRNLNNKFSLTSTEISDRVPSSESIYTAKLAFTVDREGNIEIIKDIFTQQKVKL